MQTPKIILGIETSCDDTSVCLLRGEPMRSRPEILAHLSYNAEELLSHWGGVVPEIAAREHVSKLTPVLKEAFQRASLSPQDLDLIAVTCYPGLMGPLLTGLSAAKTLSLLHHLPILPVNHLFAHLEAIHLSQELPYPYLGLLVSGGHSMYFLVSSPTRFKLLGSTIDDAAGEAFDKGGKLMGLSYPAGREIDELAKLGDPTRFSFPVGLRDSRDARLSFSGVKTSLRFFLEQNPQFKNQKNTQDFKDLCASYQHAIIEALSLKLHYAQASVSSSLPIVVGGGVACNSALRKRLQNEFAQVFFVEPRFCTDNGAMIAGHALRNFERARPFPECLSLDAQSRYLSRAECAEALR